MSLDFHYYHAFIFRMVFFVHFTIQNCLEISRSAHRRNKKTVHWNNTCVPWRYETLVSDFSQRKMWRKRKKYSIKKIIFTIRNFTADFSSIRSFHLWFYFAIFSQLLGQDCPYMAELFTRILCWSALFVHSFIYLLIWFNLIYNL